MRMAHLDLKTRLAHALALAKSQGFLRVGSGEAVTVFTTVTGGPHLVIWPGVIPPGLLGDGL